jgi:hypothetical protein
MENWTCDSCGGVIENPEDGWVEWIEVSGGRPGEFTGRDLRLVHFGPTWPNPCQFDQDVERQRDGGGLCDLPLRAFLGPNGLMYFMNLINMGRLPVQDVLEMMLRCQVPGYDRARPYFAEAVAMGVIHQRARGVYFQNQIDATLEYAGL